MNATPSDGSPTTQEHDSAGEKRDADPSEVLAVVLKWLRDYGPNWLRHYWDKERPKSKWHEIAMVILTVLIAGAAIYSAWIFQGQLSLMKDADRPWIKVKVTANTDYVPGSIIGGPLSFDQEGRGSVTSKISLENIGRSVAVHVYVRAKMVAIGISADQLGIPIEEQRKLCDGLNTYDIQQHALDPRYTIFPNDTEVEFQRLGFETSQIEMRPEDRDLKNGKPVEVFLVGCVDYGYSSGASSPRQTGFIYQMLGKNPRHGIQTLMTFSVDQLSFEPYVFGGQYAY